MAFRAQGGKVQNEGTESPGLADPLNVHEEEASISSSDEAADFGSIH